jgi:hypothetical protein
MFHVEKLVVIVNVHKKYLKFNLNVTFAPYMRKNFVVLSKCRKEADKNLLT